MKKNDLNPMEIENYLNLDLDDLYISLTEDDGYLHNREWLIIQGRKLYDDFIKKNKHVKIYICDIYQKRGSTMDNALDLSAIIMSILSMNSNLQNSQILPITAIMLKIGLTEICK